jgi:protein O-mannosyl-transferase
MRRRLIPPVLLIGLFLVATFLAFSTNLNSYFISDDFVQIGKVLHGDFSVAWGQSHGGFFRPLFILSYIVDSRVWHDRPFGYHLTNFIIHALNSFFVFKLGLQVFQHLRLSTKVANATAIAAAALFLLHPSHTEAVIWISGRADLIATFFVLASLWCFCTYANKPRALDLALALAFGAAALLAKESAICLPFLILILGFYLSGARKTLAAFGAFALILIAFVLVRAYFLGTFLGGYGASQHLNFTPRWIGERLLEAEVRSVLPALPSAWSFFLFRPLQSRLFIIIALAFCGLISVAVVVRRKRYGRSERKTQNKHLLVLTSLFLISLLPVINLRVSLYESLGERFLYLPTVFSCLLISYVSIIFIRNPKLWFLIIICALGFYSWRLYPANQTWREASQLTRDLKNDLATSASQPHLTILNAPDNLRGVPVFHNGLPEALQFFQNQTRFDQVEIVAFQTLRSRFDEVYLRQSGDTLMLQPGNTLDSFTRTSSSQCLELIAQSETGLQVRPRPCLAAATTYFFSGGKMRRILER